MSNIRVLQCCCINICLSPAAVGILAAMICKYKKAKRVVMIDNQQYRLDFAQTKLGVETLNFDQIPKGKDVPEVRLGHAAFRGFLLPIASISTDLIRG